MSEIYRVPNTSERETIVHYETVMTKFCLASNDILVGTEQNVDYMKTNTNKNASDLVVDNIYVKCDNN